MTSTKIVSVSVSFALFCCVFGTCWVQAQTGDEPPAEAQGGLEEEAQALFSTIEEKSEEFAGLQELMAQTSGEDAKAFRKQGGELIEAALTDLERLAGNIVDREKDGLNASSDRDRVSEMMRRGWSFFWGMVERDAADLSELRRAKDNAAADEIANLDREIFDAGARYDRVLELTLDLLSMMEEFGLTVTEERTLLGEQLREQAELVAGRILVGKDETARLERRLAAVPSNTDIANELDVSMQLLDRQVERLRDTIRLMDSLEIDTAEYRQLLFEATGEITTGLFSREVLTGLTQQWARNAKEWIADNGPGVVFKGVLFVLILLVFRVLAKIARKVVHKAIRASSLQVSMLLERTALTVTGAAVMIFGVLVALSQLGFQVGPLLAGLGVVGFIVGFALQDTLSNFASGVMILLYRPYDVGDLIETAGAMGKVENMTLVSTTILTVDHQTLVIPNSKIWGDVIKNVTAQKERRIDMVFGIGYADDIPHAERVLTEIVEAHEQVLEDPEPVVKLHNLGDSSVDFVVRPWVATDDYWDVYWDITREVKIRFDAEKISIPFPQRDVHLYREGGGESA